MYLDPSIDNFIARLSNIVRPNKFLVEVVPPNILGIDGGSVESLIYHAQSASIPDRNFNEIPIKFYGMDYKIPASEITQDLNINFIVDDEWKNRELFERWANLINDRTPTQNAIKADTDELFDGSYIIVRQLNFKSEVIAAYKYEYIFPKTVDQIELNQETMDTYETFQVTFAYSYWQGINIQSGSR